MKLASGRLGRRFAKSCVRPASTKMSLASGARATVGGTVRLAAERPLSPVCSTNASTCAAIRTFANQSTVAKRNLASSTTSPLVDVKVGDSAVEPVKRSTFSVSSALAHAMFGRERAGVHGALRASTQA